MSLWLIAGLQASGSYIRLVKNISPGPSTRDGVETVRLCAFAPPGSPLNPYIHSISTAQSRMKSAPILCDKKTPDKRGWEGMNDETEKP